jgi:prophage regulatory protein
MRVILFLLVSISVWRETTLSNTILRLPQVKIRVGLSRSSIYAAVSKGSFPKPIRLGTRSVGWLEVEIEAWVSQRVEMSRKSV